MRETHPLKLRGAGGTQADSARRAARGREVHKDDADIRKTSKTSTRYVFFLFCLLNVEKVV